MPAMKDRTMLAFLRPSPRFRLLLCLSAVSGLVVGELCLSGNCVGASARRDSTQNKQEAPWTRQETADDPAKSPPNLQTRSGEHTSELQSHHDLVCRLLLE